MGGLIEQSVKTSHGCGELAPPAQPVEDTGPLIGSGARNAVSEREGALVGLLEIGAHRDTSLFDEMMQAAMTLNVTAPPSCMRRGAALCELKS